MLFIGIAAKQSKDLETDCTCGLANVCRKAMLSPDYFEPNPGFVGSSAQDFAKNLYSKPLSSENLYSKF